VENAIRDLDTSLQGVSRTDLARELLDQEILQRAVASIETDLQEDPIFAARLYHTVGKTYHQLGIYDQAKEVLLRAVEISKEQLGDRDPQTLAARHDHALAINEARASDKDQDAPLFREIYELCRQSLGEDHPQTLASLASVAELERVAGNYVVADSLQRYVLDKRTRMLGPEDPATLQSVTNLAAVVRWQEQWAEAESLRTYAFNTSQRVLGPDHPRTLDIGYELGIQYDNMEKYEEAASLHENQVEIRKRVQGVKHDRTLREMQTLAHVYSAHLDQYDEAEVVYRDIIAARSHSLGPGDARSTDTALRLAKMYLETLQRSKADSVMTAAINGVSRVRGEDDPETLRLRYSWALALGPYPEEKAEILEDILAIQRRVLGDGHLQVGETLGKLGDVYIGLERDEAEALLIECVEIYKTEKGPQSSATAIRIRILGEFYSKVPQDLETAAERFVESLAIFEHAEGPDSRNTVWNKLLLGNTLVKLNQIDRGRPLIEEFLASWRRMAAERPRDKMLYALFMLTGVHEKLRDVEEALQYAKEANELTDYEHPWFLETLALAYNESGETEKAIETLEQAIVLSPVRTRDRVRFEERLAEYQAERDGVAN
jgi:tetratricopeptide (TPR) repeat protein